MRHAALFSHFALLLTCAAVVAEEPAHSISAMEADASTQEKLRGPASLPIQAPSTSGVPLPKSKDTYLEDSKKICTKESSTRGELDERRYSYCIGNHTTSYLDLVHIHKEYSTEEFYTRYSLPFCTKDHTKRGVTNVQMLSYCLDVEIEGYKNVQYYRTQYDVSKVDALAANALRMFQSWQMADYIVESYFE